ncbi:MAG: PAS domain S-box protein [Bacteroidetes bacterium]|nr:PAS domain S-box protein [Bacteroidota bacterium]
MIITDLIYNLSFLVSLSIFSGFIDNKFKRNKLSGKVLQGIFFGTVAIIGMVLPIYHTNGAFFDGRSVVLSLSALFFGPLSGFISFLMALICRIYLGGNGVIPGVILIAISFIIGSVFNYYNVKTDFKKLTPLKLYVFGLIVHLFMFIIISSDPVPSFLENYFKVVLSVVVFFPVITLVAGKVLLDQDRNAKFINEISERKELYRTTLYSIGDAVITTDINGEIRQMNPIAEQLTGWREVEANGKKLKDVFNIINEITREKVESPVDKILIEDKIIGLANHILLISKNGDEIPIADSGAPIHSSSGEVIGVVLVFRDQTKERSTQRALRESEEIFTQFMKFSPIYVFFKDAQIRAIRLSKNYEQLLGKPMNELIGKNMFELFPSDLAESMVKDDKRILSEGKVVEVYEEFNGKYYRTIKFPIHYDGIPIYLAGFTIDVTEAKEAEEKINTLSKGIEQSPAALIITDIKGNIEYVNPKFTEVTGYTFEEIYNKNMRVMKSGYHDELTYKILWETISNGNMWKGDLLNKKKNGELFWEHVSISPIRNDKGDITNFIAVKEDISERKKMMEDLILAKEKAEKANQLKSEFLAQMSHEIRSPINTMVSFTSLIEDELHDKSNKELEVCFTGIDSASKRVIRTIDLILNMSELQLGTYEISRRNINISDILYNLLIEYMKIASSKKIELNLHVESENVIINSDEYAVSQIFANLLDNAIKYTNKGRVDLSLVENEKGQIIVKISDTGIGISPEYLENLFEPFSQEEQGYSRKFEGNGLGMSLVKRYCDLINAEISVESEKNKGTTFTVILPKE